MIFVDASAMVAVLTDEPERAEFLDVIEQNESVTSPLALFEAALALSRKKACSLEDAENILVRFTVSARIRQIAVEPADFATALDAARRFGKGRGHPAQLNLGDCFAYASARNANAKLLYKGGDFSRTDIAVVTTRDNLSL